MAVGGTSLEGISNQSLGIRTPKTRKGKRALENRAPKNVENGRRTLILHGTKTSNVLNSVLTEIYHLKKGGALKYTRKNEGIHPFESGGETSLELFSQKADCSLIVYGSHSKKRPNNIVIGRTYDYHIYDLVEVGVESFRSSQSFVYDRYLSPKEGSKPFIVFVGEGFENEEGLRHLKEMLLELFRGETVDNISLAGLDRAYVCSAVSTDRVFLTHCSVRLKKSGTVVPRIELIEVGPSMDLVLRRHRLPNDMLRREAMKSAPDRSKKVKNVKKDEVQGKIGRIYIPDQKIGNMALQNKSKGLKRQRRESKVPGSSKKSKDKV